MKIGLKTATSASFGSWIHNHPLLPLYLHTVGETVHCFTRCMLCIAWPTLKRCVWPVNIEHRGHIKRLFNPIIQQAAVQKADAGKKKYCRALSVPCCPLALFSFLSHSFLSFLLSPLPHETHSLRPLHPHIPLKPTFVLNRPLFFFFFKHLLWHSCRKQSLFLDRSAPAFIITLSAKQSHPLSLRYQLPGCYHIHAIFTLRGHYVTLSTLYANTASSFFFIRQR